MSTVHKFVGTETSFNWEDVVSKEYADGAAKGASGKIMIGNNEGAPYFVFRYFRVEPGGYSTMNDHHGHDHGVMMLHGRAKVHLGDKVFEVGPRDIVYIHPWEYHYLETVGDEPMGFLCVIPNKDMLEKLKQVESA